MYQTSINKIEQDLKDLKRKFQCGTQFFATAEEFPEVGKECAVYVDKSTGAFYVYDPATGTYISADTGDTTELSGAGVNEQVTYWTGASTLGGDGEFTYNSTTNLLSSGNLQLTNLQPATVDTDKFLVSDLGTLKTRTGAEVLSDIGGVGGTGTAGQVAYWSGTTTQTGSNNLFYDSVNQRVGVGTASPAYSIDVNGTIRSQGQLIVMGQIQNPTVGVVNINSVFYAGTGVSVGVNSTNTARLLVRGSGTTSATTALLVQNSTPTALLQVNDDGRIQQTIPGATNNTIFGTNAGASASLSGINNTFFGASSGQFNTTGSDNTSIGFLCLRNNQAGSGNLAVGRSTLRDSTSSQNTAIGAYACSLQSTGSNNTAIGYQALNANTTGSNNTAIGRDSLLNIIGSNNVSLGLNSGRYLADGITALTIANQSLFIGNDTRANANSETNQIVIGNQAIGLGSNTTVIGNSSTTQTHLYGSLTLGDTTLDASAVLDVSSTTKGFLPPRMTTAERDLIATPAAGLVIFNTTTTKLECFDGAVWQAAW